jgi:mannosylglycoprotein endo-beta-mannosidase
MFLVLGMKGFPTKFVELTRKVVENGKVNIMVNGKVGPYFVTRKGLRQGDPFSPLLFNVAADVLATLVSRAQEQGFIKGLIPEMYDGGLTLLQYADDTIFVFEDNLEYARNLKIILCTFEHLTGLKINFSKSEVYCFGSVVEKQEEYAYIFTCKVGEVPFRYLGMPVHYKRLCKIDWRPAEEKVEKKCPCWQGGPLSFGGRIILTEICLSNVPGFMMSFFRVPKGVLKRFDFFRARVLWQEREGVRKYHLVKWADVCQPRDQGGLGLTNLDVKNISLLCKWLWRLENEEGDWQKILKFKYFKNGIITQDRKYVGCSHFWSGLMEVKNVFYSCCKRVLGDGCKTRFWEDVWVGEKPLSVLFPRLYNLTFSQGVSVARVFAQDFNCIRFRRCLYGESLEMWNKLLDMCGSTTLSQEPDRVSLKLTKSGIFSVKLLYTYLMARRVLFPYKMIWRLKVPLKIKAFIWLIVKNRILTKINLAKKGWKGSVLCEFCGGNEDMNHLFFECPMAKYNWNVASCALGIGTKPVNFYDLCQNWLQKFTGRDRIVVMVGTAALLWNLWKTRNASCFQQKFHNNPTEVIFSMCRLMDDWNFLQKEKVQELVRRVSERVRRIASEMFCRRHGWAPMTKRICDG